MFWGTEAKFSGFSGSHGDRWERWWWCKDNVSGASGWGRRCWGSGKS